LHHKGVVTPAGVVPRLKTFTVSGLFEVGMFEYDSGLALIRMEDAQKLYRMEDRVSGVRLKLDDLFKAPLITRQLANSLDTPAFISDWTRSHANFFRAVQIEKNMMFIILSLIVAVAAFNIVSTLVMAVTDKQADIAILRTLGASPSSIMAVFMVQGALIGFIGLGLGVAGGVALALQCRCSGALHRAHARDSVHVQGGVLHLQPAVRVAVEGCDDDYGGVLRFVAGGDTLSKLACLAHQSGGGTTL